MNTFSTVLTKDERETDKKRRLTNRSTDGGSNVNRGERRVVPTIRPAMPDLLYREVWPSVYASLNDEQIDARNAATRHPNVQKAWCHARPDSSKPIPNKIPPDTKTPATAMFFSKVVIHRSLCPFSHRKIFFARRHSRRNLKKIRQRRICRGSCLGDFVEGDYVIFSCTYCTHPLQVSRPSVSVFCNL